MIGFVPINYASLNARQKEIYNFHQIAARLSHYGYHSMWLNDDWQGADFIACHIDGETVLRVQLKGRLSADKKYLGKSLHIAFRVDDAVFVYPHDDFCDWATSRGYLPETSLSWGERGIYNWPGIPGWAVPYLDDYKIAAPAQ